MEFNIADLAVISSNIQYNPALGVAVNRLLSARSQVEYDVAMQEATQIAIGYENVQIYKGKDYGQSSYLPGMPLWQPLRFLEHDTLIESIDKEMDGFLLENAVLELSRTKNIVSTVVQGRDTSVDEFINNGDWQISVSGILTTGEPKYPIDKVFEFQEWMDRDEPIKVQNEILNKLGIDEIVILTQSFPKTPYWNIQTYSFTAKETQALPLIINLLN